ncbi:MAG: VWA domain-containing protein [Kiritimatiellae bacterium]|nr:VWA domain-containing protein [Kiritimatiellia bacterium]
MFRFENPMMFLFLFLFIPVVYFFMRCRVKRGMLFSATSRISHKTSWRSRVGSLLPLLYLAGLVFVIIALARPQTLFSSMRQKTDSIAIAMVVDVSGSMEALDFSEKTPTGWDYITRLDVVKETFAQFVEQHPDDLVALLTFGGYVTTVTPLTMDDKAVLHALKGVTIPGQTVDNRGQITNQEELMTAIGDALATACARVKNAEVKSKIIVLLSDGESNTGLIQPDKAAKLAKELGIKVYTIGVGTNGQAPFMAKDMFGNNRVQYANVTLDEALLQKIADETDGKYFNVKNKKAFESAMEDISKLEKTTVKTTVYNQYNELFVKYLLIGILLLILSTSLNMVVTRNIL